MSIKVTCTECGKELKASEELVGKKCKCPGCGRILLLTKGGLEAVGPRAPAGGAVFQREREAALRTRMVEYHNEKWNFSMSYPEGWKIWENKEGPRPWETAVALAGPVTATGRPAFVVGAREGEVLQGSSKGRAFFDPSFGGAMHQQLATPAEYLETAKELLRWESSGLQFHSAGETHLAGNPAARLVYSCDSEAGRTRHDCITVFAVGVTFHLSSGAFESEFAAAGPLFKRIVESFRFGRRWSGEGTPAAAEGGVADADVSAEGLYNRGVSLYRVGNFREAMEAFGRCVRSGKYLMQAAYAKGLCQKELGLEVRPPAELGDRPEDAGPVYVASNLACYLIENGHQAKLTKEGSDSRVDAIIEGARYKIQILTFEGTFLNWAWRKQGGEEVSVPDSDANPNPTPADKLVVSLLEKASTLPMSPLPPGGLHPIETVAHEAEETTPHAVVLTAVGQDKTRVVEVLRAATGLGTKDATELVDRGSGAVVKSGIAKEAAEELKGRLEKAGATVLVMTVGHTEPLEKADESRETSDEEPPYELAPPVEGPTDAFTGMAAAREKAKLEQDLNDRYPGRKEKQALVRTLLEAGEQEFENAETLEEIVGLATLRRLDELARRSVPSVPEEQKSRASRRMESSVRKLLQDAGGSNLEAGATALQKFFHLGPTAECAVPILMEALHHHSASVRLCAVEALSHIGPAARYAVPALLWLLQADRDNVAMKVWLSSALAEFTEATPFLVVMLGAGDEGVREMAAETLVDMKEELVPNLAKTCRSKREPSRRWACIALGRLGDRAKPALPEVLALLKDDSPRVREEAARTAGRLGVGDSLVAKELLQALSDGEAKVRGRAAQALGGLKVRDADVAPCLQEASARETDEWTAEQMRAAAAKVHVLG